MTQSIRRLLLAVSIAAIAILPMQAVAQGITSRTAQGDIIIVPGTTPLTAPVEDAVRAAFLSAGTRMKLNTYYAPTSQQVKGNWYFISMAGFDQLNASGNWSLEDGQAWFGLVLVTRSPNGTWSGAVEGTPEYAALLKLVPQTALSPSARLNLDPAFRQSAAPQVLRFPWQSGTSMMYGVKSVHEGGFAILGTYKAVDLLSDGDISAGHAPNKLLAATSGSIDYVCDDGTSLAIRIDDLLYVHLLRNPNLTVGYTFSKGDVIGQLRTGSFNSVCGYADQAPNWFHIHWAFPTGDTFQAGGWTLNLSDQLWHRGAETRGVYGWLLAEDEPWHSEYFSDRNLTTSCADAWDYTVYVFKQFGTNAQPPADGCPSQSYSVRMTRKATFAGGDYTFHVERRGAVRLSVDGQPVINAWRSGNGGIDATRTLSGVHEVKLEFLKTIDPAAVNVWWYGAGALPAAPAPDPALWRAEYFGNRDLQGRPAVVLNEDGPINHDWGANGPGYDLPAEDFSARYTRMVDFACGRYRFNVHADDGVRVTVGKQAIVDSWKEQVGDFQPEVDLAGESLPVTVEYFQRGWGAALRVDWELISTSGCGGPNPDLRPYVPYGQKSPVVPYTFAGMSVTSTLYISQPTYFNWYFINNSVTTTVRSFAVELYIDGTRAARNIFTDIGPGQVGAVNYWSTTIITPGEHTVKLVVDPDNNVTESDKANNTWQGTFTWQPARQPTSFDWYGAERTFATNGW